MQGRIKVHGGPRLDIAMGPYPSFISYQHTECLGYRLLENFKLQMPVGELSFRAFWPNYSPICQDKLCFTRTTYKSLVESYNEYQSNTVMNRNVVKGRQAKLRDPHDTAHVVDVSCTVYLSVLYNQVL